MAKIKWGYYNKCIGAKNEKVVLVTSLGGAFFL
jgi:hypothetical protein